MTGNTASELERVTPLLLTSRANLAYACDMARNAQDNIANYQVRGFNHQLVSLGLQFHF